MVLADRAFPQVGDQDAAPVHEEAGVEAVPLLPEDISHRGVRQKAADLVLDRGDGFQAEAPVVAGVLLPPEGAHHRIADARGHALPEGVIREEARQGKDREPAVIEERGEGMSQDVFEARPPARAPYPAESGEHPGDDEMLFVAGHPPQEVQAHRPRQVAGREVEDFVRASARDRVQDLARQVAMRIKESDAPAGVEVLDDEVPKQGALAETRFPHDV